MKRFYILLILSISSTVIKSQDVGIGSKWIYNQGWFLPFPNQDDKRVIEIVSDTLIGDEQYFVLKGDCECSLDLELILRWNEDKIIQYFNDSAHTIYDFSLVKGETYEVNFPSSNGAYETTIVVIDSIGFYNDKKVQHISIAEKEGSYMDWHGVFLEKFGSVNWCMTPQFPLCENGTSGLCEYITPQNDTIKFNEYNNCIVNSIIEPIFEKIAVSPNPTYDNWTLEKSTSIKEYKLYSFNGKLIRSKNNLNSQKIIIDGTSLSGSIYFIELIGDKFRESIKLIKMK